MHGLLVFVGNLAPGLASRVRVPILHCQPFSPSSIKSMVDSPAPDVETQARAIGITEDAISLYRQGRLTKEQLLTIPLKG